MATSDVAPEPAWVADLRRARTLLIEAMLVDERDRYLHAHQAVALAADAAVLVRTGRHLPSDLADPWPLLARVVPALGEWAAYFAATQRRRLHVNRGGRVSTREVDDFVRDADLFCEAVAAMAQRRLQGVEPRQHTGPTPTLGRRAG